MKAVVDPDLCTGCGACVDICPDVFQLGDDDIAKVQINPVPEELEEACREACDSCPVEAISIGE